MKLWVTKVDGCEVAFNTSKAEAQREEARHRRALKADGVTAKYMPEIWSEKIEIEPGRNNLALFLTALVRNVSEKAP